MAVEGAVTGHLDWYQVMPFYATKMGDGDSCGTWEVGDVSDAWTQKGPPVLVRLD